jgi:ketosteroid isomerase-like protein
MVRLFNRGEVEELLDRFAAEDVEFDYTRSLSPDQAGIFRGIDEVRGFWEALREPWQELELVGDEYIEVRDDTVVVSSHTRQVGRGSGIEVVARGAMLVRFRDGKLVRWQLFQSKAEALDAGARSVNS